MYLPHLKEEVDKIAENPKVLIVLVLLFVLIAGAGGWLLCRHYDNLEQADRDHVRATVRNDQELNRDAQEELDRAREANQDAADANQNAQRAADDLADSTAKLSDINRSDTDAIDAQSESLTTLSEQINREAHKTATAKRQRDTLAVVAGVLAVSCLIK